MILVKIADRAFVLPCLGKDHLLPALGKDRAQLWKLESRMNSSSLIIMMNEVLVRTNPAAKMCNSPSLRLSICLSQMPVQ